jgi:hypothetical protein
MTGSTGPSGQAQSANYVSLFGDQTVSGLKTFSAGMEAVNVSGIGALNVQTSVATSTTLDIGSATSNVHFNGIVLAPTVGVDSTPTSQVATVQYVRNALNQYINGATGDVSTNIVGALSTTSAARLFPNHTAPIFLGATGNGTATNVLSNVVNLGNTATANVRFFANPAVTVAANEATLQNGTGSRLVTHTLGTAGSVATRYFLDPTNASATTTATAQQFVFDAPQVAFNRWAVTSAGELRVAGGTGFKGDILTSSGAGAPAAWISPDYTSDVTSIAAASSYAFASGYAVPVATFYHRAGYTTRVTLAPTTFVSASGNATLTKFECVVADASFNAVSLTLKSQTFSPAVSSATVSFDSVAFSALSTGAYYVTIVVTASSATETFKHSTDLELTLERVAPTDTSPPVATAYPEVHFPLCCNGATGAAANDSSPRYVYNAQKALVGTVTNPNSGLVQLRDESFAWASFFATGSAAPAPTSVGYNGTVFSVATDGTLSVYDRYWDNTYGTLWDSTGAVAATLPAPALCDCMVAKYLMNGRLHWAARVTGNNTGNADFPVGSTVDKNGGVYACGTHDSNGTTNLVAYNASGTFGGTVDSLNNGTNNNGYVIYWTPGGNYGDFALFTSNSYDGAVVVAPDDANNCVYAVGHTSGGSLTCRLLYGTTFSNQSFASSGYFLARMKMTSASSASEWVRRIVVYSLAVSSNVYGVALEPGGSNVYSLCYALNTLSLYLTGSSTKNLTFSGKLFCLCKWSAAGTFLFAVVLKTSSSATVNGGYCCSTPSGVFLLANTTSNITAYNATDSALSAIPSTSATIAMSSGSPLAVLKYSHAGVLLWSQKFACTGSFEVKSFYTLGSAYLYACFFFTGQVTFAGTTVGNTRSRGTLLARIDDSGGITLVGYTDHV